MFQSELCRVVTTVTVGEQTIFYREHHVYTMSPTAANGTVPLFKPHQYLTVKLHHSIQMPYSALRISNKYKMA